MTDPTDVETVREFIARCLPSIDHLDALLLLARDESRTWTSQEAAGALYCAPQSCEKALTDLVRFGLAELEASAYRYRPATDTLRVAVSSLETMNRERPVSLIREIYRESPSARSFSDAFRLRRTEDDPNG
jgi:DNA-binding IclR family transcriptional regulator